MFFIEIINKKEEFDSLGKIILNDLKTGFPSIEKVRTSFLYYFENDKYKDFLISLLKDEITDNVFVNEHPQMNEDFIMDINVKPGVMDPAAITLIEHLNKINMNVGNIIIVKRHYIYSKEKIEENSIIEFTKNKLFNPLIETINKDINISIKNSEKDFDITYIDLNCDLEKLSNDMILSLNLEEMQKIKNYFDKENRKPTDIEIETIAQTWSEHCVHKTFKSTINYNGKTVKNLFKETIVKATENINHKNAVSVFHDNAGIWKFDEFYNVCFKVETHNHPSALEPYGGAGTGIGGVIRDVIGTGLGAKPIANTDVFCVGTNNENIPEGTIQPDDILKGVVSGVRDYGNRMGIPTVNGAVCYHEDYAGNPLVYAGSLGIMKNKNSFKEVHENDMIILIGGKTGRDGIHGATFSSVSLNEDSQELSFGAVQIGNPIEEKKMLDAIMEADGLYSAITDCGAGGLSSAVGEMGEHTGAEVILDNVPLKYEGLSYAEIWISESQERMVLSVPEKNYEQLKKIMEKHNTNISHIGYFRGKDLKIFYKNKLVCDLDMHFLHKEVPLPVKEASPYKSLETKETNINYEYSLEELIEKVVNNKNIKPKDWIIRQYDHEVQAQTVIKPLGGKNQDSLNDAAVIMPIEEKNKCIVMGNGINPKYGKINPEKMTYCVIDEAMRNILAQGGNLENTAMLDNFSWGNVNNRTTLGALYESAFACKEYAEALGVPFISGKDSLNNYYLYKGKEIEIPPTLLISAISITNIEDIRNSYFAGSDNYIYIFGKQTENEMAGSVLHEELGIVNKGILPNIDVKESANILHILSKINKMNIIESAHDVSEGGLIVSLLEMTKGNNIGFDINFKTELDEIVFLFSETQTRIIIEVKKENAKIFESAAKGYGIKIGITNNSGKKIINNRELKINI